MIDGKSHAKILSMTNKQRHRWYQTLSFVDRGIVMEIVETARRAKISAANMGKTFSDKTRGKLRASWTPERRGKQSGENSPSKRPEVRAKMRAAWTPEKRAEKSVAQTGKKLSKEVRAKLSVVWTGENNPMYGKTHSKESKAKMSGENHPNWQGGVSFESYCELFNFAKKEEVRNRDERTCQSCGKSEILEGRRLDVHHIDGDKMNTDSPNLAALCRSCNSSPDTVEKEFLIVSNLNLSSGSE